MPSAELRSPLPLAGAPPEGAGRRLRDAGGWDLRRLVLAIHRWAGLTVGAALLLFAITGGVLVVRAHFEPLLYGRFLDAPACARPLPLDRLASAASAAHRHQRPSAVQVDLRGIHSVGVQFADKDFVYLDPCSARILGVQNEYGGIAGTLDYLHRFRFVANGRVIGGWLNALSLIAIVIGGIWIWWPRSRAGWRPALTYDRRLPRMARNLSLHRVFGIYGSALLLLMSVTGIPLSFGWAKELIAATTHSTTESPRPPRYSPRPGAAHVSMQQAWETVRRVMPATEWATLRYPKQRGAAIVVETLERGAPHEEANSYVFVDPATGAAAVAPYATGVSAGRKAYLMILALHSGLVGGIPFQLALLLACFAVPVQAYSGLLPWLSRKLARPRTAGLRLRLAARHAESSSVTAFEFVSASSAALPPFSAGSHIDLTLPNGITRQYSLCNDPGETHRYMIAVLREADSRGGSQWLHDSLSVGDAIEASLPRNHFPLAHEAAHSVLIAGGIGITPLLCMAERLSNVGASFELHYCVRSLADAAFASRISAAAFAGKAVFYASDEGRRLNVADLLSAVPKDSHVYTCGPARLIDAVLDAAAAAGLDESRVHREYFAAAGSGGQPNRAFHLTIASTGATIRVGEGETVVEALARIGMSLPTSCSEGICGTCITPVLEGEVEHRDLILSPAERARHDRMTPCCSRACGDRLVLDL